MNVSVFGLGKLGLPMAAVFAEAGHLVTGVDLSDDTVSALNSGRVLIDEPGLENLVRTNAKRLTATKSPEEAIARSEISFVIVPTPSGPDDAFINTFVESALRDIGAAIRRVGAPQLVVVASTVMPGSTRDVLAPALEESMDAKLGDGVELCYSPEFIALGSVVRDLMNPDMILVGARNDESGEKLVDFYRSVSGSAVPHSIMSWSNAELAKIAVNSYVTTKISFANMIADLCESMPDGDVDAVTEALGLDSRIGPKYLKGGLPFGGPCFPRDNRALAKFAETVNVEALLPTATDATNEFRAEKIADSAITRAPDARRAAVLGIAYKPNTSVYEESAGLKIAGHLASAGIDVTVYDEYVSEITDQALTVASTAEVAVAEADIVVLGAADDVYVKAIAKAPSDALIVDCWRALVEYGSRPVIRVGKAPAKVGREELEALG